MRLWCESVDFIYMPLFRIVCNNMIVCSRKMGTNVYQLASDQSLMFWGGELTRELDIVSGDRSTVLMGSMKSTVKASRSSTSMLSGEPPPVLEVGIRAGAAGRSRYVVVYS